MLELSLHPVAFSLSYRNPLGVRPEGQWICIEGVSWVEAWCERDDAAASDGRGVNCASFSSVAAAEAKPDA
jgi:hypothetical protein